MRSFGRTTFVTGSMLSILIAASVLSVSAQRGEFCGPGGCWFDLTIIQAAQPVEVRTLRGPFDAMFESNLRLFPDREAEGFIRPVPSGRPDDEVLVTFVQGHAGFDRDGSAAGVILFGRTAEGRPIIIMIVPDASEDCLIYTTIGTNVNWVWRAPGRMIVTRR